MEAALAQQQADEEKQRKVWERLEVTVADSPSSLGYSKSFSHLLEQHHQSARMYHCVTVLTSFSCFLQLDQTLHVSMHLHATCVNVPAICLSSISAYSHCNAVRAQRIDVITNMQGFAFLCSSYSPQRRL